MVDNRFKDFPVDYRFPEPGVDVRFATPGVDARFIEGVDTRFEGDTYGSISPISGTSPVLAALSDGDTLSTAVTWGSYASTAGTISGTVQEMSVNGAAFVAYNGATVVAADDTYRLRETVSDSAGTTPRPFFSETQAVAGVAPTVTASDGLVGRTLTITVDSSTGAPAPTLALNALTSNGADVLGAATGTGPWQYVVPDSAASRTIAWTVTATNVLGSATSSGSEVVAANLESTWILAAGVWDDTGEWDDTAVWQDAA